MKLLGIGLTVCAALACAPVNTTTLLPPNVFVVNGDHGGVIREYTQRVYTLNQRGVQVVIDGLCASACTLYLTADKVCFTQRATFGFHSAQDVEGGNRSMEIIANRRLADAYREVSPLLAEWFLSRGQYYRGDTYASLSAHDLQAIGAGEFCN